jgi:hypothetical protein
MTGTATVPASFLSLGNPDCAEFQPLWQSLQEPSESHGWRTAATVAAFLEQQRSGADRTPVEFAVVWQSWSDEFPPTEIVALMAALPLCRIVCVTGPWCEADLRTRRAWPPALATPWWQAGPRLLRELEAARTRSGSALPWTASREEVWLHEQQLGEPMRLTGQTVAISVSDAAMAEMLQAALVSAGANLAESSADVVDFILIDVDPWNTDRSAAVRQFVQEAAPSTVLGLTAWPTADLSLATRSCGVTGLISKLSFMAAVLPTGVSQSLP